MTWLSRSDNSCMLICKAAHDFVSGSDQDFSGKYDVRTVHTVHTNRTPVCLQ